MWTKTHRKDYSYNNGYVILNSQEKLQEYISDLELLISKISTNEVVTLAKPSYKLNINNPENRMYFQKNLNLRVYAFMNPIVLHL
jgi:hypothetical protein